MLELTGKRTPRTGLEGKFSVYHSCACAVMFGRAGEEEYSDETVASASVIALRDRVQAAVKPGVAEHQAEVRVTLKSGEVLQLFVEHALGSLERPMTDADLDAKFRGLAEAVFPEDRITALMAACRNLAAMPDVCRLVPLMTAPGATRG